MFCNYSKWSIMKIENSHSSSLSWGYSYAEKMELYGRVQGRENFNIKRFFLTHSIIIRRGIFQLIDIFIRHFRISLFHSLSHVMTRLSWGEKKTFSHQTDHIKCFWKFVFNYFFILHVVYGSTHSFITSVWGKWEWLNEYQLKQTAWIFQIT